MPQITTVCVCLSLLASSGCAPPRSGTNGMVTRVVDGDTIDVLMDTGETLRVRLRGIDAPERDQPFGLAAADRLNHIALGNRCRLAAAGRDRYGRTIGDVFVDGEWVNRNLVASGLAWHWSRYHHDSSLVEAEQAARAADRGLWNDVEPVPPWNWRKQRRKK